MSEKKHMVRADTWQNRLRDGLLWWVTPPHIEDPSLGLRVQLFLGLLLLFVTMGILPVSNTIIRGASVVYLVPSLASLVAYLIGRFGSYRVAGILLISVATLSPLLVVMSNIFELDGGVYLLLFFNMGLIASLLANLLYGVSVTLFVIGINVSIFVATVLNTPLNLPMNASSIPIVIDSILIGVLIIVNTIASHGERETLRSHKQAAEDNTRRIQTMLDYSPDIIMIRNDEGYAYINKNGADLLGITDIEAALHQPDVDFEAHCEQRAQHVREQLSCAKLTVRYDGVFHRSDGEALAVNIVKTVIAYKDKPASMIFARPIEDHAIEDHAIEDPALEEPTSSSPYADNSPMMRSDTEARDLLIQSVLRQAVVAELGVIALSAEDKDNFYEHVVVLVGQALGVQMCAIYSYEAGGALLRRHSPQDAPHLPATLPLAQMPFADDLTHNEACLVTPDSARRLPPDLETMGWHYGACLPVTTEGGLFGLLIVLDDVLIPDEDDMYFLQSVANLLSSFITTRHAQDDMQAQRHYAEILRDATVALNQHLDLETIFETILRYLRQLIPSYERSLLVLHDETGGLHFGAVDGIRDDVRAATILKSVNLAEAPLLGRVLELMQPLNEKVIRVDDYVVPEWVRQVDESYPNAFMGVPIMLGEQCLGALMVYSSQVNAFDDKELDYLVDFADKIAIALQNARLKAELEARVHQRTQQFRQERQQLQAILDATNEGILYTEGRLILFANRGMSQLLGYAQHDFIGRPVMMLAGDGADEKTLDSFRLETWREHLKQGRKIWQEEVELYRAGGQRLEAEMTFSVLDSDEATMPMVIVVRDVGERKALETQKARFISTAAHELRSPITSLNTRLYLMKKKPDEIETVHMPILERSIQRINRLVADLLDLSSFEHGRLQIQTKTLIIQDVLHEVYEMESLRAASHGVHVWLDLPAEPIALLGDADRLYQVFNNLLVNAIHYTPEGGYVTVLLQRCADDAKQIEVHIQDSGQGIAPDAIEDIFRPFFRLNEEKVGTGLGLTIANEIVLLHGGSIGVQSEPGVGSTFIITLPTRL